MLLNNLATLRKASSSGCKAIIVLDSEIHGLTNKLEIQRIDPIERGKQTVERTKAIGETIVLAKQATRSSCCAEEAPRQPRANRGIPIRGVETDRGMLLSA